MKRIIMFVLLFAALKVAGQTTGYLRFDTVRIMKQNGTCELYIINNTKDSLGLLTNIGGGLTQFKRSRAINDSMIVVGLDTLKILGRTDQPEWVSVTDYGAVPNDTLTDYTTNIQAALNTGARTVLVPTGLYILTNSIKINSNQTIIGYGAKFIRKANTNAMIINESDGSVGAYEADSNMAVIGITFEGNGVNYPTSADGGATLLVFGHSKNITIRDCEFTNTAVYHLIEVNSSKNVLVDNVYCHDANIVGRELLQIDLAQNSLAFPWFGPYDNTPCDGVTVRNCVFKNSVGGGHGVGTHNATNNFPQKNITIEGCYFENIDNTAILVYHYAGLTVRNNTIKNCRRAVRDFSSVNNPTVQRGVIIEGNRIYNLTKHASDGSAVSLNYYRNITIENNQIDSVRGVAMGLYNCDSFSIRNNVINNYGTALSNISTGIELSPCTNGEISGNKIQSEVTSFRRDAIAVLSTSKNISIVGNIVKLPSLAKQFGASAFGQHNPLSGTNIYVGHNIVNDTSICNTIAVSTTYQIVGTEGVIQANTSGGAYAITVQPRFINEGLTIIKNGASALTVTPNSGTINGASSITVDSVVTLKSDGFNYYTVGGGGGAAGVTDHGALTGLGDDDHTQYALLAGRSGGQSLIGGTGTTDDLVLQSTAGVGASGADIIFKGGNNGATEFARFLNSGNFGLGTNNPSVPFELTTSGQTGLRINISNTGEGTYGIRFNRATTGAENAMLFSTNNVDKWFLGQNNAGGGGGDDMLLFAFGANKYVMNATHTTGDIGFGNSLGALFVKNDGSYVTLTSLDTDNAAPSTTGTVKNVVTDAAGKLSFADRGVTSINSQTGEAITIQSGTATSVVTTTNTVTVNVTPSSNSIPHTLDALYTTQGNTGTSETDLYSYSVPANKLSIDGRTVNFEIDGEFNDNTATATLKLYFGGNVTLNTGAVNISTANTAWKLTGYIIRTSSSTAHVTYQLECPGLATQKFLGYSNLTSLDFTVGNIFKVTAQAGGAGGGNSDITAHSWQLLYKPQPQ